MLRNDCDITFSAGADSVLYIYGGVICVGQVARRRIFPKNEKQKKKKKEEECILEMETDETD